MKKYDTAKSKYDKELIDTLWNVNRVPFAVSCLIEPRINRYIMECKSCAPPILPVLAYQN